jgi:hypothetical protein
MARVGLLVAALWAVGCAGSGPRSAEAVRDAYVAALERDDPKAAYALLSPDLQAQTPYPQFAARWKSQASERAALLAAAKRDRTLPASYRGATVHDGGRVVEWAKVDGRYYVTAGLPGRPLTSTPAQTVRALITAVRTTDFTKLQALLGDDLAQSVAEDWKARTEAMEAALDRPGAIELSADLQRAELRYESNRVLTLEQSPDGWRITSLE